MSYYIFGNTSMVAILLASMLVFCFHRLVFSRTTFSLSLKLASGIFLVGALILIIILQGRASWIGLISGMFYTFRKKTWKLHARLRAVTFSLVCFVVATVSGIKKDSSSGRMLVYTVCMEMFRDKGTEGVGFGKFKQHYNYYQATYFKKHGIDNKPALLADSGCYAFCDPLQLLIELGLIRGIIHLLICILLFIHLHNSVSTTDTVQKACLSGFVCIATASLFSYPFQVPAIEILLVTYLVLFVTRIKSRQLFPYPRLFTVVKLTCIMFFLACLTAVSFNAWSMHLTERGTMLSRIGHRKEAIEYFVCALRINNKNYQAGFSLAKELYISGKTDEAFLSAKHTLNFISEPRLLQLCGDIEMEKHNFTLAERSYLLAVYMVPNRMAARVKLFEFYLTIHDSAHADYWANSVLKMRVKIPSAATASMQNQARLKLQLVRQVQPWH